MATRATILIICSDQLSTTGKNQGRDIFRLTEIVDVGHQASRPRPELAIARFVEWWERRKLSEVWEYAPGNR